MTEQTGDWMDAGNGARIRRVTSKGVLIGIDLEHPCATYPGVRPSCNWIPFLGRTSPRDDRRAWTVESESPLSIRQLIECRACGDQGFVEHGKWIPL